jgi:hypothetical protein
MDATFTQMKKTTRYSWITLMIVLACTTIALALGGGRYRVNPWSFGVNGDTQWTPGEDPTGRNPNNVSAAVADALNVQFINKGVKFVIQAGDLSNYAGDNAMYTRAEVAQSLYYQGIGFFPLRGNHETFGNQYGLDPNYDLNIPAFRDAFPQTQGTANTFGAHNFTWPDITDNNGNYVLKGLSYSFDYGDPGNNARFVVVDVEQTSITMEAPPLPPHPIYGQGWYYYYRVKGWIIYKHSEDLDGLVNVFNEETQKWDSTVIGTIPKDTWFRLSSSTNPPTPTTNFQGFDNGTDPFGLNPSKTKYDIDQWKKLALYTPGGEKWPGDQQNWISGQLDKSTRGTEHAFVFSHRGLMGANHVDCLFGSGPGSKAATQEPFYASLMNNGVKYMISAHDHLHNRAVVKSPNGSSQVEQIISTGASTKFYSPSALSKFGGTKSRETQISQEINNIGFYIYTVDGPRVTVDYYSDETGNFQSDANYPDGDGPLPNMITPAFNFVKKETWGYSLNGQQFLIAQGGSYTGIEGTFGETTANILAGANNSTSTDFTPNTPRALTKTVNTGWVANPDPGMLISDLFSLWGMSELGAEGQTDTYVLSISFDFRRQNHLEDVGIATFTGCQWVNAVDENFGGEKNFVIGPYSSEYGLGTYGVDPDTKTAWAVLNYNADFAVTDKIDKPGNGHHGHQGFNNCN